MSILPDHYDFTIWQGATFRTTLTLYTGSTPSTPPRDFTGSTASLVIRDKPQGTTLLTLDTTNGGITLGGLAGTIQLLISAAATTALTWKSGVYELSVTAPNGGDTDVLLWGHFKVKGI